MRFIFASSDATVNNFSLFYVNYITLPVYVDWSLSDCQVVIKLGHTTVKRIILYVLQEARYILQQERFACRVW